MRTITTHVVPLLVGAWMLAGMGVLATASGAGLWASAGVLVGIVAAIGPTLDIGRD